MKTKAYILSLICLLIGSASFANHQTAMDTVVIKFGNNSQIVIVTDNADDLKSLEKYDLNKIVKELNMSLDDSGETKYLVIEDESGKKYLRDTTITIDKDGDAKIYVRSDDDDDDDDDDRDWDDNDYRYKKTRGNFEIEIGTSNWIEDGGGFPSQENYAVRPWGSWYVGLVSRQKTSLGGPLFIEWGPSVTWYNWKFEDESVRVSEAPDQVIFTSTASTVTAETDFIKSKLSASYLNFSFVPVLDFSYGKKTRRNKDGLDVKETVRKRRGIRFGVGGYAGMRLGSKTKIVTNDGGGRDRTKDRDDFQLSNFRYGVRAQFGFKGFDFFANYDLNTVFQENTTPKLNGFSFGLVL